MLIQLFPKGNIVSFVVYWLFVYKDHQGSLKKKMSGTNNELASYQGSYMPMASTFSIQCATLFTINQVHIKVLCTESNNYLGFSQDVELRCS